MKSRLESLTAIESLYPEGLPVRSKLRLALGVWLCMTDRGYLPGRYSLVRFAMRELTGIECSIATREAEEAKLEYLKEHSEEELAELEQLVGRHYEEDRQKYFALSADLANPSVT